MRAAVHVSFGSDVDSEPPPPSVAPAFQLAAVASMAGLRDSCGNVPLDLCVLVRTTDDVPPGLGDHSVRVFLNVDGMLSLQEIAAKTGLSLPEVIEAYLDLLGRALVDTPEQASGMFRKIEVSTWGMDR